MNEIKHKELMAPLSDGGDNISTAMDYACNWVNGNPEVKQVISMIPMVYPFQNMELGNMPVKVVVAYEVADQT